jgi:broad specificity phosphatase PhoE
LIRLILVRHGNTFESGQIPVQIGKQTDLPLTSYGISQAEQMKKYLQSHHIVPKAIFAGNLKRQTQFASILNSSFNASFQIETALTEIDYGDWEGLTGEEISTHWPNEYKLWNEFGIWPQNVFKSSLKDHQEQINSWLEYLRKTHQNNDTLLAVSSNGLLRLFYQKEKVKTGHFCDLILHPTSIEVLGWNLRP